jgi:3-oxoacid CoA-transferase subunit A
MGRVFVTGDLHGDKYYVNNTISQIDNPSADDFIIVCGDAGFEYEDYNMGMAKKAAKRFPGVWIVLRGNHDSCYWDRHTSIIDGEVIAEDGWDIQNYRGGIYLFQKKYPNIWYLPDEGCIYRLGDYNILFIPGAYSVDKWYRLRNGYPWNPKEQLTEGEKNDLSLLTIEWLDLALPIDFVIAHTFPLKLEKYYNYLFMDGIDQSEVDKSTEEWLDDFSNIYENAEDFKHYFGGHFHSDIELTDKYTMLFHEVVNLADYEGV